MDTARLSSLATHYIAPPSTRCDAPSSAPLPSPAQAFSRDSRLARGWSADGYSREVQSARGTPAAASSSERRATMALEAELITGVKSSAACSETTSQQPAASLLLEQPSTI